MAKAPKTENTMGPGPQHGDPLEEEIIPGQEGEENNTPEPKAEPKKEEVDRIAALEATIRAMEATITGLTAPRAEPKRAPDPEPEPDWSELLFKDPKAAVDQITKRITTKIESELTGKYQKDQGEREFWNQFYQDNPELKDDDFIVRATLNANLEELAPMRVGLASKRLAELTRQHIMRYTGNKLPSTDKKAVTEGSQPPSPKKQEPEPPKVVTLSDLIKARRANRMKGTAA